MGYKKSAPTVSEIKQPINVLCHDKSIDDERGKLMSKLRALKYILCSLAVAQITFFAGNAMAECYKYYSSQGVLELYPTATDAGSFECSVTNTEGAGVYYNTATNTYSGVNQCTVCQSPMVLVSKTITLNNGCDAIYNACAVVCATQTSDPGGSNAHTYDGTGNCASYTTSYVVLENISNLKWTVKSCDTCNSGYYRYAISGNNSVCDIPYYACAACTKVVSSYSSWSIETTGRERRTVTYTWDSDGCSGTPASTYEYRCAAGYYGNGTTCTACPSPGQSSAGSTSQTSCCVPTGVTTTDEYGTYKYTSPCCWS